MEINEIRTLKGKRLTAEERFLLGIFDGLTKEESLVNEGSFLYFKGGHCYFYHDVNSNLILYDIIKIWDGLFFYCGCKIDKTNNIIYNMINKYLKINTSVVYYSVFDLSKIMSEHQKLKRKKT